MRRLRPSGCLTQEQTIWLFDTGAEAHVMAKHVWEQLGELTLQTTRVTMRGANRQDLGAMGELQVRGVIGQIKVQFTAVVARDARRCPLSGTQLGTEGYTTNTKVSSHNLMAAER